MDRQNISLADDVHSFSGNVALLLTMKLISFRGEVIII